MIWSRSRASSCDNVSISTPQGDVAISDGQIMGDEISFVVVRNRNNNEVKMLYTGKVRGDEINFKMSVGERPPFDFVARRI